MSAVIEVKFRLKLEAQDGSMQYLELEQGQAKELFKVLKGLFDDHGAVKYVPCPIPYWDTTPKPWQPLWTGTPVWSGNTGIVLTSLEMSTT